VGLKAVNSPEVGGKAEGVGAGVGAGEAAPDGAAALLTSVSPPPGRAWRSSVLKVPEEGSKTNSVEKLGLAASSCAALGCSGASKLMAGLLRVKLSSSESKSKEDGRGLAAKAGDGRGV